MKNTDPALRLREARLNIDKTLSEIAVSSGISLASYCDLESHSSDLASAISLRDLRRLSQVLGIEPASLFSDEKVDPATPSNLPKRIAEYIGAHGIAASSFSDQVGYDVTEILESPDAILGWNVDCLRAVCQKLGIDWLTALP
jgi:transcriptional regulator with XRE-family HTH domain